jgi:hypothetical protein
MTIRPSGCSIGEARIGCAAVQACCASGVTRPTQAVAAAVHLARMDRNGAGLNGVDRVFDVLCIGDGCTNPPQAGASSRG